MNPGRCTDFCTRSNIYEAGVLGQGADGVQEHVYFQAYRLLETLDNY
jgi:hypothetical protein